MSLLKIKQIDGLQTAIDTAGGSVVITVDNFVTVTDYTEGTTTQLTLSVTPDSEDSIEVKFNGLGQHHDTFTVASAVVTFDAAIPVGVTKIEIKITNNSGTTGLNIAQEWTKTQSFDATTLTDAANISWDAESNQVTSVTLAGNRTLDNPTNMKDGATYIITVKQDVTGTRTLSFGSAYKWSGGTAPTLSTGTNAVDILTFVCDGTNMYGVAQLDFS